MPAGHLAALFNAQGPNANCLTACAASSQAIGEATEIIRRGEADVMLSGGAHSMIHPFGVTGFNLLTALSERNDEPPAGLAAVRPAPRRLRAGRRRRDGRAGRATNTPKRGRQIYGEIVGYGTTADAFRITDTHPEGRGATTCMKMALADAGMNPDDIALHQRPRHQHRRERQGRDRSPSSKRFGEAAVQDSRDQHQKHDGPPDRRGRARRS